MRGFELSPEEIKELRFSHKKEKNSNKAYRINAVILLGSVWTVKIFKKNVMCNKYYEKFESFKTACLDFFKHKKRYMEQISSIMGDGLEALAYE